MIPPKWERALVSAFHPVTGKVAFTVPVLSSVSVTTPSRKPATYSFALSGSDLGLGGASDQNRSTPVTIG